jgi:hypothetical protein
MCTPIIPCNMQICIAKALPSCPHTRLPLLPALHPCAPAPTPTPTPPPTPHPTPHPPRHTQGKTIFALGSTNTGSTFHSHGDAWFVLVHGMKRFLMYPSCKYCDSYCDSY